MLMVSSVLWASHVRMDSLLNLLDKAISNRPHYIKQKQTEIDQIVYQLGENMSLEGRFDLLGKLEHEYHHFNVDSALAICGRRLDLAKIIGKQEFVNDACIGMANVLALSGMYKEAVDMVKKINLEYLPHELQVSYSHTCQTLYGMMADYANTQDEKQAYIKLESTYRDSLLILCADDPLTFALINADAYNDSNRHDEGIKLLANYPIDDEKEEHNKAFCYYTLSESYRLEGNRNKQKECLALAATSDMKAMIREYVALRKLAVLLYEDGDIDRAYHYVGTCLRDAMDCNARLRKLEILEVFPVINAAYQQKEQKQLVQMAWALGCISLLALFLGCALLYINKVKKSLLVSRQEISRINEQLKELNKELLQVNGQLRSTNRHLAESSYLKETYIGRYMDQCSVYLEKMNEYRRTLGKIAASGNVDELYKSIKSTRFIETELKEFYANFDNTFLQLFPTFVEDFNALLVEDKQVQLKEGELMNTELRIYALIRLGITDSVKIAQFLRYSVTTIYNYRVKVRNKATGDRDSLEDEVMKIGKMGN